MNRLFPGKILSIYEKVIKKHEGFHEEGVVSFSDSDRHYYCDNVIRGY